MKNQIKYLLIALALPSTLNLQHSTVLAQGTAFTYQGRLNVNGSPVGGSYDLAFTLFVTNTSGVPIAGPVTNSAVAVSNGLFTTTVDFGNVFTGASNWLEIAVSAAGSNSFSTLRPRQQLTPVPYAIFANTASNLSGTISSSQFTGTISANQLSGTVSLAQLPAGIITNGASGVNISGTFSGNGAGVTNVSLLTVNTDGAIGWTTNWGSFATASSPGAAAGPVFRHGGGCQRRWQGGFDLRELQSQDADGADQQRLWHVWLERHADRGKQSSFDRGGGCQRGWQSGFDLRELFRLFADDIDQRRQWPFRGGFHADCEHHRPILRHGGGYQQRRQGGFDLREPRQQHADDVHQQRQRRISVCFLAARRHRAAFRGGGGCQRRWQGGFDQRERRRYADGADQRRHRRIYRRFLAKCGKQPIICHGGGCQWGWQGGFDQRKLGDNTLTVLTNNGSGGFVIVPLRRAWATRLLASRRADVNSDVAKWI